MAPGLDQFRRIAGQKLPVDVVTSGLVQRLPAFWNIAVEVCRNGDIEIDRSRFIGVVIHTQADRRFLARDGDLFIGVVAKDARIGLLEDEPDIRVLRIVGD